MVKIRTLVVMDIETTGLPQYENNGTGITEICLFAATRNDIKQTSFGELPRLRKFSTLVNSNKRVTPGAVALTGITNSMIRNAPSFEQVYNAILSFLNSLQKPVCLVAHNGDRFDYKIFLAECCDNELFEPDVLCVDSLYIFRNMYKSKDKISFKLIDIYRRFFGVTGESAHRAEADCAMLLKCIVAAESNGEFMEWADAHCKMLGMTNIPTLATTVQQYLHLRTEKEQDTAHTVAITKSTQISILLKALHRADDLDFLNLVL